MNLIERAKAFYHRKLDGYTLDEYLIMFVTCSIFLPYFCSIAAIIIVLIYLAFTGRLIRIIRTTPRSLFAFVFAGLSVVVSLCYGNLLGVVQTLGLLLILIYYMFYRSVISKRLFVLLIDACCIISIFCFIWALMEYFRIIDHFGYSFLELEVEDAPRWRVNSTFFNANFYAAMIEFLVLCCVYKLLYSHTLRRVVFYWAIIIMNLFALYLTGCRAAWPTFVVAIPVMFLLTRHRKSFAFSAALVGCVTGIICGAFSGCYETGLSMNGYLPEKGVSQVPGVVNWIYFVRYVVPIIEYVVLIILLKFMDLEKKLPKMQAEIQERHRRGQV